MNSRESIIAVKSSVDFCQAKFDNNNNFSILHLNIHSVHLHIEELRTLLALLNYKFDFIAITESKICKNITPIVNIDIDGYSPPLNHPTEATKGGVLLYSSNECKFVTRPDLNLYSPKEIESTFIEVVNSEKKNDIIGVIYRHHTIDKSNFTNDYLSSLMDKLKIEQNKNIYIAGDFNFNL